MPRKINVTLTGCICLNPSCTIPYGFCHCGCGEKTKISKYTYRAIGWVSGMPTRFIMGHANRQPRQDFSDAHPFKINGVYCKLLALTRGLFAIIDASDYEWLSQWHWYALWADGAGFYVVRHSPTKKKVTGKHIYLHRFLLGLKDDDPNEGDHRNGVTLDHRRANLRILEVIKSRQNHKIHCTNTSGREGVSYDKSRNKWAVRMRVNGKMKHFGRRDKFEEACALREAVEKTHKGEFIRSAQPS